LNQNEFLQDFEAKDVMGLTLMEIGARTRKVPATVNPWRFVRPIVPF
jgi:hypothetical protein